MLTKSSMFVNSTSAARVKTIAMFFFALIFIHSPQINYAQSLNNPPSRQVVLQGFWWDYWNSSYPNAWSSYLADLSPRLKELGIDAVWVPVNVKNSGTNSV
ncbi:MAG: hypothetical protein EBS53_06785, partial [Bacteroidetes bacterium]|nr:hypothetical protein [Bacteroidota bacterium]